MKFLPLLLSLVLVTGCASQVQVDRKTTYTSADATVLDKRTSEQKAQRRDSNFSAISFMSDDRFAPRAVDLFVNELVLQSKSTAIRPVRVEIDQFRVADFFPQRLGAGGQGFLGVLVFQTLIDSNTDWSFVEAAGVPRNVDSIICVFVGRIDGAPVKVAAVEPYRISPFAGLVVNDPGFRRALGTAVRRAASQALAQLAR